MPLRSSPPRPDAGSSTTTSDGGPTKARASATKRCWPVDKDRARRPSQAESATMAKVSRASASAESIDSPRTARASMMFSSTVSSGMSRGSGGR